MRLPALEDLQRQLPSKSLERGLDYWRAHRVLRCELRPAAESVTGRVQGSASQAYDVEVALRPCGEQVLIHGVCSCPVSLNCKHVAAVLLEFVNRSASNGSRLPGPTSSARAGDHDFEMWLAGLRGALHGARAATLPVAAADESVHLLFLLKAGNLAGADRYIAPVVELLLTRALQSGAQGKGISYQLEDLVLGTRAAAQHLGEADRALLARWLLKRAAPDSNIEGESLNFEGSAHLLADMIRTGRCHWISRATPPLTLGHTRGGCIEWIMYPDGSQRPKIVVEANARPLLVQPLWYLDEATRECGPLSLVPSEQVARQLLLAPAVRVDQVPLLRQALGPWSDAVPLPPTVETQNIAGARPVPRLVLGTYEAAPYATAAIPYNGAQTTACAFLTFDYAGHEVDPQTQHGEAVCIVEGDVVYRIARQMAVERAATERLNAHSLRPVHESRVAVPPLQPGLLFTLFGRAPAAEGEDAWLHFMMESVPQLRREGWRIDLRADFPYRIVEPEEWYLELEESPDHGWFDMGLGIRVGGKSVNLLPLLVEAIQRVPGEFTRAKLDRMTAKDFIILRTEDGASLPLPVERVRNILGVLLELYDPAALNLDGRLRLPKMRAADLGALEKALPGDKLRWLGPARLQELSMRLQNFRGVQEVKPAPGFCATLRHYQQEGLNWLQFLREYELAGILADDMGLGKTVQTLAHLATEKSAGRMLKPTLIVAPTSLMLNWRREAERFAPDLRLLVLHGAARKEHFKRIPHYDVVLTTYALLVRDDQQLLAHDYYFLILDEAQYIKNPKTKATLVAQQIKAQHRLCLTGTPMENHLGELWSVFNFLMPGLLGDDRRFAKLFRTPIEKHGDSERQQHLRQRLAPFMLRRTKDVVATELPPKTEIVRSVALEAAQRDLYETIRVAMQEKVRRAIETKGLQRSHIEILDALLKLRQVCCDPRLVKLEAARRVKESAKLELLMDMLPELIAEGRRVLLFSQFTAMLSLIEADLKKQKIPYTVLTGDTTDRPTAIGRFERGEVPLFLISLKAGGTGLNLTAADTVIHYDPWWNPAVERQATDRAHRIGQDKPVFVYKLLTAGTVEERIAHMQARKQALADGLLAGASKAVDALQAEDLQSLFAPLA